MRHIVFVPLLLASLTVPLAAQNPGEVLAWEKISKLFGNGPNLASGDQFGRASAVLGDVDGDGIDDLAVGALGDDEGGTSSEDDFGAVYILFMNADGSVRESSKIGNTQGLVGELDVGDELGRVLGDIGDWDGDGVPDLAVGATDDDDGGSDTGALYMIQLSSDGTVKKYQKISDTEGNFLGLLDDGDQFGRAVMVIPDLDDDGVNDLVVGSVRDDGGGSNRGAIYVLFMNADMTVKDYQRINEDEGNFSETLSDNGEFGFDFCNLGDKDGDGNVEIVVAAPDQNTDGDQIGALFVLYLDDDGTVKSDFRITEGYGGFTGDLDFNDEFGASCNEIGDLDKDGNIDIAVGAGKDDDAPGGSGDDRGAVWVLFLNADGTVKAQQKISATSGNFQASLSDGDRFGTSLAWPGDWNGDGIQDVFAGARFDDDGGNATGSMFLLFLNDGSLTPPTASFSGGPPSGPAPHTVAFTDLSTGDYSTWDWDFGDGGGSTVQDPTHTYTVEGAYSVTLTVDGPAGDDSKTFTNVINVTAPLPPVADFSGSPTAGAAPLLVSFTDASTGLVSTWSWDFGDGGMSTAQNPSHEYSTAGDYTVSLTVMGAGGSDLESKIAYVSVAEPPPVAEFSGTPTSGLAPLLVGFSDLTTGEVTSWAWDFGDGGMSTVQNPSHQYTVTGSYTVSLIATGAGGSDQESKADYVVVAEPAPVAEFSGTPPSGTAPLTVAFTDLSTGNVSAYAWDFGDGGMSTAQNPSHEYATAGDYTVSLTVTGTGGSDLESKVGYVSVTEPAPVAEFSGTPTSGTAPLTVVFTDLSTGNVTAYAWDFGDGGMSTAQNPSHEYATVGDYTVSLTVTGTGGSDLESKTDLVSVAEPAPLAEFSGTPTSGTAPLTVVFTDLSTGSVSAYAWDFGDGGMSTAQNPSHEYATAGDYTVSLTVTGTGGSDLESKVGYVSVTEPAPVAEFSGTPTSGTAPLTVVFSDLSTGSVSAYAWDFGDGGMSTAQNPSHQYAAVGDYTVSLTVTGAGGSDLESKVGYVSVAEPAPVAEFSGTPLSGFEPLTVAFTDLSTGVLTSWSWDFGDGGMSTAQNPSHEYTVSGDYTVSLTVTGVGGSDLETKLDYISVSPLPVFADGSFEGQTAGGLPATPWSVVFGAAHVIQPVGLGADNGLPSDGAQWVELAADGTDSATPPSNPGGAGTAPVGAAGIEQSFTFDAGMPFLVFEAAFLLDGLPSDPTLNDFLSVDVTDGTTTHNLFYRDSFSALPNTSAIHGLAMTDTETVASDLAALFPSATSSTVLTVSFQVGNVGDALQPSKGYVDHVRFAPAALATSRNGTAVNPVCFTSTSPPAIGTTWTTEVDSTAATNPGFVALLGYDAALIPGLVIPEGELLVDTTANFLFYDLLVSGGGADVFAKPIPADPSFEGFFASVQAVVLGDTVVLCNAVDITLGY